MDRFGYHLFCGVCNMQSRSVLLLVLPFLELRNFYHPVALKLQALAEKKPHHMELEQQLTVIESH